MRLPSSALLLLSALASAAQASGDGYSYEHNQCLEASGGVTVAMLECIGSEIKLQDQRLNENYKAGMQALEPALKEQLRAAQRLWIQYRDAECGLRGQLTGGTIDRLNGASCVLDMTRTRANELGWLSDTP